MNLSLRYLHVDVFTDRPLEGNQLAVFATPPADIGSALMQRIAAEMNFSESTFIFPRRGGGDVHMRIFTPGSELPMAGHPTIGSTFALAAEGVIAPGLGEFVFELGVGPTPVSLEWVDGRLDFAWMTQLLPSFEAEVEAGALASSLGLAAADTVPGLPAQVISCGVPFLLVPLATRAAVDRVVVDLRAFEAARLSAGLGDAPLFIFTADRAGAPGAPGDEAIYSRMLAPQFGIGEDPATGGAAGPLGCYVVRHRVLDAARAGSFVNLQGVRMRRPSRIHVSIESEGGRITRVRVGGRSVIIGSGELVLGVRS